MSTYTSLTLYTDGASRGNPGPAAGGVHIVDEMTKETVVDFGVPLGNATNNVAEYRAVLSAVDWLLAHKTLLAEHVQLNFRLDSQLVVSQLSGQWNTTHFYKGMFGSPVKVEYSTFTTSSSIFYIIGCIINIYLVVVLKDIL